MSVQVRRILPKCLLGALSASIAAGLQLSLWGYIQPSRFILFYPAVILASLIGGLAAGLSATLIAALGAMYFFLQPTGWVPLGIFVISAVAISVLNEVLRKRNVDLRAAEEFETIFECSPYAILAIVDARGTIVRVNPQVESVFGYPSDELIGQKIEILVPERLRTQHVDHRRKYMEAPTARRLGVGRDLVGRRKDGTEVPIEISLTPMNAGERPTILVTLTDISIRKQAEEKLRQAVRSRDEFVSIASHELKTPLTSLSMQIQLRKRAVARSDRSAFDLAKVGRMLETDEQQVWRLNRLVDDMLDVSRINSGRLSVDPQRVDICGLTQEVISRFAAQCLEAGVQLDLETCGPVFGYWDAQRIEQILSNLLTNALKYGQGAAIHVSIQRSATAVELRVRDEGPGISREDQDRIFRRFERAISGTGITGLGLGLYITRRLLELHGGTIRVDSELGRGSTFIVELPIREKREALSA